MPPEEQNLGPAISFGHESRNELNKSYTCDLWKYVKVAVSNVGQDIKHKSFGHESRVPVTLKVGQGDTVSNVGQDIKQISVMTDGRTDRGINHHMSPFWEGHNKFLFNFSKEANPKNLYHCRKFLNDMNSLVTMIQGHS